MLCSWIWIEYPIQTSIRTMGKIQESSLEPGFLIALFLLLFGAIPGCVSNSCDTITFFGLKTAECNNLGLKVIPKNMDRDIKVLDFKDNQLTYLGIEDFQNYHQLQDIDLSRNRIEIIAPDAFRGLYNLQKLELEGNKITSLPASMFDHMASVRILGMSANPIRFITAKSFIKLRNIEELDFENCWLERVDGRAFSNLKDLKEINLVNNELKTLSAEMQYHLPPSLRVLRLYRNPWICDCRLRWLRNWISTVDVNWDFTTNTPACSEPALLASVNWAHLTPEQFACPASITGNSSTSLELEVGANTTIECVVFGDPDPEVTWMKGNEPISKDIEVRERYSVVENTKRLRSSIILREVRLSHAGDYKCIAKNSAGRSEVTYKLWVQGADSSAGAERFYTLSTGAILGIVTGSITLIVILIVCSVFCLLKKDRQNHAYKVRDYKKAPKDKDNQKSFDEEEDEFDSKDKEKEKTLPTASTELLSDKQQKEKEIIQEMSEAMMETVVPEDKIPDNLPPPEVEPDIHVDIENDRAPASSPVSDLSPEEKPEAKSPKEFKMRIFSSYDAHADERAHIDRGSVTPEDGGSQPPKVAPIPPPPPRPLCNSHIKDLPPDLLRDEKHGMSNHKSGANGTYPNHIQTSHRRAEENPYAKPSDLKPAMKRHSSSQENLLGKERSRSDHYREGDRRHADGHRSSKADYNDGSLSKSKQRSREPSPCTNPVCMATHKHGDSRSMGHCGKPHIKPSRSMEGFHKLDETLEEEGSPHLSREDVRGYGDRYRTLPSRPSAAKRGHQNSPSKTVKIADPYCYPSATVGLDSPTKHGPPMLRHYAASPQKPGSGRTLPPILKSSSQLANPGSSAKSSSFANTLPSHPGSKSSGSGSRTVGFADPAYSPPQKPPRTFGTSLDDLLSPPFGNIAADKSKAHSTNPKPGEKDEFGTAV